VIAEKILVALSPPHHIDQHILRHALERQEFLLHFQPKINLRTAVIVGVEALIRWHHPRHGLVPPAQFVPIAEESGLIVRTNEPQACANEDWY
jgi:EAL domain-containing protein (putative c-di-GMP-specific phosphodiesterase class I)